MTEDRVWAKKRVRHSSEDIASTWIHREISRKRRILGNLAWAYLQQNDFKASEEYYRKALSIEFDRNKQCNLAICLMSMNKITEAKFLLQTIQSSSPQGKMDESYGRSFERASELLAEIESQSSSSTENDKENRCQSGGPYKKPYETSRNNRGWNTSYTPKVQTPFTQPRRRCTELNSKSWKPEINKNKPLNCLHRRLQFEGFQDSKFLPSRDPERKCSENQQKKANVSAENTQSKGACDRTSGNDEEDVPIYKGTKKSWADMAEEDEEESMKDLLSSSFWKTFTSTVYVRSPFVDNTGNISTECCIFLNRKQFLQCCTAKYAVK